MGSMFDLSENILPDRADFAAVYTMLRREYRSGVDVLDTKTMLKSLSNVEGGPIRYIKLRYILEIMNELQICHVEQIGEDLFQFEVLFHATKTTIDKSSILKKLKSHCTNRHAT